MSTARGPMKSADQFELVSRVDQQRGVDDVLHLGSKARGDKAGSAMMTPPRLLVPRTQTLVGAPAVEVLEPMKVRIRFEVGPTVKKTPGKNRHIASALGALLIPATLMAFVLFAWRLSSDLGLTTEFPIAGGLWSHWQVWLGVALLSQLGTILLNRYGRSGETGFSELLDRALGGFASRGGGNGDNTRR